MLFGEDDFSLRQSLEGIKKAAGDPAALATNTVVLDGQKLSIDQLRGACETMPFLADHRLVIVEGLLQRFESRTRKSSGKKTKASTENQDYHKSLADYLGQVPDFTIVVLADGKIDRRNPLLVGLAGRAEIKSFPLVRNKELRQWIQRRVAAAGDSISPPAMDLLARFVGSDLWVMASEIDKLGLFCGDRRIEEGDVRSVVSYVQEASVFTMVDAILEYRAGEAENLLGQLLQQGAAPAYLLVMLSRQVNILVRLKSLHDRGESRVEIQRKLWLPQDWMVDKALRQAEKYSLPRLREIYHRLLEADLSIKTGRLDAELTLNILIAELCQRGLVSTN
ncbi:DNA polymerase III subunit delta [Chloroflexota bacterium]